MNLKIFKPFVIFDLETTGINTNIDKIVEIAIIKYTPGQIEPEKFYSKVNPGCTIPKDASDVHGITNEMVENEPNFQKIGPEILRFISDSDITGFNSNKFDIPLLITEFQRINIEFDLSCREIFDISNIYRKLNRRRLVDAYTQYTGKNLDDAHSAMADTEATGELLFQMVSKHKELPNTVDGLVKFDGTLDLDGKFKINNKDEVVFTFGKHKDKLLYDVILADVGYINWMLSGDMPITVKTYIRKFIKNNKK